MASEIISESIMIIASVILVGILAGVLYSSVSMIGTQYSSYAILQSQKLTMDLQIVYATNTSPTQIVVYLQNVGMTSIPNLQTSTLYVGPQGQLTPVGYGTSPPSWNSPAQSLNPGSTVQLTISLSSPLKAGYYTVMFVSSTGFSTSYTFQVM